MAKEEIKKKHEEKRKVISYKKLDFKVYWKKVNNSKNLIDIEKQKQSHNLLSYDQLRFNMESEG